MFGIRRLHEIFLKTLSFLDHRRKSSIAVAMKTVEVVLERSLSLHHKSVSVILFRFYSYNDFICSSINKWLYNFIPFR